MQNVDLKVTGDKLVITIDLTSTFGASKSGKSIIIATTSGNHAVAPGVTLGLNVYRKA